MSRTERLLATLLSAAKAVSLPPLPEALRMAPAPRPVPVRVGARRPTGLRR